MTDETTDELVGRKLRIYMLSQQDIMDLLSWREYPPYWVELPAIDIPKTSEILAVNYNHEYRCFDLVVRHESFDEVPACTQLPREENRAWYRYKVKVEELLCDRPVQGKL